MDGLAVVTTRIGEIESRLATLVPPVAAPAATSFARALSSASAAVGPSVSLAATGTGAAPRSSSAALAGLSSAAWNRTAATGPSAALPQAGRLNAAGVPVELGAYGNGKIPATALQTIGHGNHRLWAPAATAFRQMEAAAARDGVHIGVTDSYRSYDNQVDLAQRKGLYSQGGLAARPGTSDHGWGRSLDLDLDSRAQTWLRGHGSQYGFAENVAREPWHWTFSPTG